MHTWVFVTVILHFVFPLHRVLKICVLNRSSRPPPSFKAIAWEYIDGRHYPGARNQHWYRRYECKIRVDGTKSVRCIVIKILREMSFKFREQDKELISL